MMMDPAAMSVLRGGFTPNAAKVFRSDCSQPSSTASAGWGKPPQRSLDVALTRWQPARGRPMESMQIVERKEPVVLAPGTSGLRLASGQLHPAFCRARGLGCVGTIRLRARRCFFRGTDASHRGDVREQRALSRRPPSARCSLVGENELPFSSQRLAPIRALHREELVASSSDCSACWKRRNSPALSCLKYRVSFVPSANSTSRATGALETRNLFLSIRAVVLLRRGGGNATANGTPGPPIERVSR